MRLPLAFLALLTPLLPAMVAPAAQPAIELRWNHAGYAPAAPKILFAGASADLAGHRWSVLRTDAAALAEPVRAGTFGPSVAGAGDHTPFAFNHLVDLSALATPGTYRLVADSGAVAEFRIADDPYAGLRAEPLQHLRFMRSGPDVPAPRRPSHLGDAHAPVFVPDGAPAAGKWRPAHPARKIDVLGGWYDAGDQIKFTLNIAYTSYHLLLAYRIAPDLWGRTTAGEPLPAILDEARFGLEFLLRTFPDHDTFVLQVGDERDHEQPFRLPEDDALDGARPALCALSRTHMASAAAALALGARTFREFGRTDVAARYEQTARALVARTHDPDTVATAFERGKVNDFYLDPTENDQRALAAAELFALTGEQSYLDEAIALAPPPAEEVGWACWNWLANFALAAHAPAARQHLLAETSAYAKTAATTGRPWGIPGGYVWGSLHRWIGDANAARLAALHAGAGPDHSALFWSMLDYTFGRNSWGVGFLFSEHLDNSVREIYSPAYLILGVFPTGALSEGPGDRATHDAMERHFEAIPPPTLARFDTPAAVFRDSHHDFMCQESTIVGQADIVLMLTLAARP